MATYHQRAPGDYRSDQSDLPSRRSTNLWRWLIPLALVALALWGLFGRRDHRPMLDQTDTTEPSRVPMDHR